MDPEAVTYLFQEELYQFKAPVTIVLPRAWHTYTEDEQLLLKKILTSVKVDINAVQMVVRSSVDLGLLSAYAPARVLIFGAETLQDVPLYQNIPAQGFSVIKAGDLNMLDDQKKKNLWIALRQMFGV